MDRKKKIIIELLINQHRHQESINKFYAFADSILQELKSDNKLENIEEFDIEVVTGNHNNNGNKICITNIEENLPEMFVKSGIAQASKHNTIFIIDGDYQGEIFTSPEYASYQIQKLCDLFEEECQNTTVFEKNKKEFRARLKKIISDIIKNYYNPKNHIHEIWFSQKTERIDVVVGIEVEQSDGTGNKDLGNYGDKIALMDTCMFLSRNYYSTKISRSVCPNDDSPASKNVIRKILESKNLVVIGGPGTTIDPGNKITEHLMKNVIKSKISYGFTKNEGILDYYLICNGKKYTSFPQFSDDLSYDYGYFACFNHPEYRERRIILLNGTHTIGVLGAYKVFSYFNENGSDENFKIIFNRPNRFIDDNGNLSFECFFKVENDNEGSVRIPKLDEMHVFPIFQSKIYNDNHYNNAEIQQKLQKKTFAGQAIMPEENESESRDTFGRSNKRFRY